MPGNVYGVKPDLGLKTTCEQTRLANPAGGGKDTSPEDGSRPGQTLLAGLLRLAIAADEFLNRRKTCFTNASARNPVGPVHGSNPLCPSSTKSPRRGTSSHFKGRRFFRTTRAEAGASMTSWSGTRPRCPGAARGAPPKARWHPGSRPRRRSAPGAASAAASKDALRQARPVGEIAMLCRAPSMA